MFPLAALSLPLLGMTGQWRNLTLLEQLFISIFYFFCLYFSSTIQNSRFKIKFNYKIKWNLYSYLWILVGLIPLLALCSWRLPEFPLGGDQDHHSTAFHYFKGHWLRSDLYTVLAGILIWFLFPKRYSSKNAFLFRGSIFFLLFLFSTSVLHNLNDIFRYPTLSYLLAIPGSLFPWYWEFHALIFMNSLGWLLYAFLFRSALGLSTKWGSLIAILLFLCWPKALYFVTSSYLESWALIFSLLSLELALEYKNPRIGVLFMVASVLCKESFLIVVPFLTYAHFNNTDAKRRKAFLLELAPLGLPLLFFFLLRNQIGIQRSWTFVGLDKIFSVEFLKTQLLSFQGTFGNYGMALFFALFFILALFHSLWSSLFLVSTFLFFFLESSARVWPAYPRFYMLTVLSVLIICVRSFPFAKYILFSGLVVMLPQTFNHFQKLRGPAQALNFIEHVDAPIFYPFRELVQKIEISTDAELTILFTKHNESHDEWIRETLKHYGEKTPFVFTGDKILEKCHCLKNANQIVFIGHLIDSDSQKIYDQCKKTLLLSCQVKESALLNSSQGLLAIPL